VRNLQRTAHSAQRNSAQRTAHSAQRNSMHHSAQRTASLTAHSAQRTACTTAHSARHHSLRLVVQTLRVWTTSALSLGCPRGALMSPGRYTRRTTGATGNQHGTARHGTCGKRAARSGATVCQRVYCQHRIARCPAHSPAARCHTRHERRTGWLSFCALCALASACALRKSAVSLAFSCGATHARTHCSLRF
jgi:hypothetical protein